MKKIILILTVLLSLSSITSCSGSYNNSSTEYKPFNARASENCAVESSDIYIINGVPSLKYICNNQ